jgi:isoquinoline 1-oxidoreductase subunit beta
MSCVQAISAVQPESPAIVNRKLCNLTIAATRLAKGRVLQSNFNDYRMLRIDQIPPIEVYVIKSGEAPGGIGETGATAAPPALRNAIYAATGIALRRLPIDRDVLAGRKPA